MLLLIGMAVLAGVLGSVTDWLFMGVLFHAAYNRHPEVWRPAIAAGRDKTAVLLSVAIGFVMSFAIVGLCALADAAGVVQGTGVALLAWMRFSPSSPRMASKLRSFEGWSSTIKMLTFSRAATGCLTVR